MLRAAAFTALATTALAAAPTQVQLHPSAPNQGELSVDFVGSAPGAGSCQFGARGKDATVATTQFAFPNIGTLHQAVLDFGRFGLQGGDVAWYTCSADGGASYSANASVTPITAAPPRAAIFGDFGIANDVIMSALAADAGNEVRTGGGRGGPWRTFPSPTLYSHTRTHARTLGTPQNAPPYRSLTTSCTWGAFEGWAQGGRCSAPG
jgi:hypothetical protein